MRTQRLLALLVGMMMLGVLLAACGGAPASPQPAEPAAEADSDAFEPAEPAEPADSAPDAVTLQLKWVPQAQFAGYYAAADQGYYAAEGLDVTIRPGAPDIVAEQVVASGQAEFGIDWLPSLLAVRDQGTPLLNIAQVFRYSSLRQLSWKESNITSPEDLRGKKVGIWFSGTEFSLLATLKKYDIDPDTDVLLVQQPFDMNLLLNKEVESAAATTYNELYQVLSAGHTIDELDILDFNKEGTAMLEDGIFVREDWLQDEANRDIAARFVRASLNGWIYCRDNAEACVESVLQRDESGVMSREAQQWQMDEINKIIWGDPLDPTLPIGYMDPAMFKTTAEIALQFGVVEQPASPDAYTHDIWLMAVEEMDDVQPPAESGEGEGDAAPAEGDEEAAPAEGGEEAAPAEGGEEAAPEGE